MKKILIVNFHELGNLPPVINLIDILLKYNFEIDVLTFDDMNIAKRYKLEKNIKFHILEKKNGIFQFILRKLNLRKTVKKLMIDKDLIWTTTDMTVREIGKDLFKYTHIMQLMELVEDIPLFPYQRYFKTNLKKYAQKAKKVVVPEYNRAHIQQAWWNLNDTPIVLPNKPSMRIPDNIPNDLKIHIDFLKNINKKIVIYQGIIRPERPLEHIAKALETKKEEFIFCIMGRDENKLIEKLRKQYSCIYYVPFTTPPYHLQITSLASIGVLSYISTANNNTHYSLLNQIYCAPNKIFEYSAYGVPMIGNDVPGLKFPLENKKMGVCYKADSDNSILESISIIMDNYESFSNNATLFFNSVDLETIIIKEILNNEV